MYYRKAEIGDLDGIYDAMKLLQNPPLVSKADFFDYLNTLLNDGSHSSDVWVCENEKEFIGYIHVNRVALPRFSGFGVELEEVVVKESFQGKGIGRSFLKYLLTYYSGDKNCRKMIVKTDDYKGAGKLYSTIFTSTEMRVYQEYINKI